MTGCAPHVGSGRLRGLSALRPGACAQVLDDSTCKVTRQLVDEKAAEWAERGVRCEVVRRTNRQGYKAGALKDVSAPPPQPCDCSVIARARQSISLASRAAGPCSNGSRKCVPGTLCVL